MGGDGGSPNEGAAATFYGGFITYTKEHKTRALSVSAALLRDQGAVCGEVARAMAEGALARSAAAISAAITGVAGPEPDDDGNPVGRACIAVARLGFSPHDFERNYGDIGREGSEGARSPMGFKAMTDALPSTAVAA